MKGVVSGTPPSFIGGPLGKGQQAIKIEKFLFNPNYFHRAIKPDILKGTGDFGKVVGKNPDIGIDGMKIILRGASNGPFKGKTFETGLSILYFKMRTFYSLRIDTDEAKYDLVSDILGVKHNSPKGGWIYEVIVGDNDTPFNFTEEFTSVLHGKMDFLKKLNITEDNIAIWMIYEYNGQCNFEFSPKELEKLSSHKITLCISCYDGGTSLPDDR